MTASASPDIYALHEKAFANVSAFVVLDGTGSKVATVAIRFPRDGASRLWAYVHVIGLPMQRASASGYGYDKRTPAVGAAFHKAAVRPDNALDALALTTLAALKSAIDPHAGAYWDDQLRRVGFVVLQAV